MACGMYIFFFQGGKSTPWLSAVFDMKGCKGKGRQYLVKWRDYPMDRNEWCGPSLFDDPTFLARYDMLYDEAVQRGASAPRLDA